jgi:uncharacterized RDD family membrane protein YckC
MNLLPGSPSLSPNSESRSPSREFRLRDPGRDQSGFAADLVLLSFAAGPVTLVLAWLAPGAGMGFGERLWASSAQRRTSAKR